MDYILNIKVPLLFVFHPAFWAITKETYCIGVGPQSQINGKIVGPQGKTWSFIFILYVTSLHALHVSSAKVLREH